MHTRILPICLWNSIVGLHGHCETPMLEFSRVAAIGGAPVGDDNSAPPTPWGVTPGRPCNLAQNAGRIHKHLHKSAYAAYMCGGHCVCATTGTGAQTLLNSTPDSQKVGGNQMLNSTPDAKNMQQFMNSTSDASNMQNNKLSAPAPTTQHRPLLDLVGY
jgi:hypothetical protein